MSILFHWRFASRQQPILDNISSNTMSDDFLKSMTFSRAGEFLDKCDCEECENVPPSIREIVNLKKLERRATGPIKRTQQRSLIGRDGQVSVWCMHMPKNAEPLVEFGSSHRIVWVKQLESSPCGRENGTLKWIGNGIIGSSDEEKSRTKMADWNEGNFFLVPSNGGKAIGWIHARNDSSSVDTATKDDDVSSIKPTEKNSDSSYSIAVLYVAKIPLHLVDTDGISGEGNKNWTNILIECCRNGLASLQKEPDRTPAYYKFSGEDSKLLKSAFCGAEGIEVKEDHTTEPASKKIRLDPLTT